MSRRSVTLTWSSDALFRGAPGPLPAWLRALAPFLALLLAACATTAGPAGDPAETARKLRQRYAESEHAFIVDHGKFARTFGAEPTPHPEAIQRTLGWYRSDSARR